MIGTQELCTGFRFIVRAFGEHALRDRILRIRSLENVLSDRIRQRGSSTGCAADGYRYDLIHTRDRGSIVG